MPCSCCAALHYGSHGHFAVVCRRLHLHAVLKVCALSRKMCSKPHEHDRRGRWADTLCIAVVASMGKDVKDFEAKFKKKTKNKSHPNDVNNNGAKTNDSHSLLSKITHMFDFWKTHVGPAHFAMSCSM